MNPAVDTQQSILDSAGERIRSRSYADVGVAAMLAYFEGVMMMAKKQKDPEVLCKLLPSLAAVRFYSFL